ncbi:MAG: type II toxin-antitoxin system VapC family toxin [Propionibacteriaceae bacterium]|nr:type II toxin-antitoxin system VapC family toxin [Propionibacteriaceae bacterium]
MTETQAVCGVYDTSLFIAAESGRRIREELLPAESVTTVITLAELTAGVLAARDTETRARRLNTLSALSSLEVLTVDQRAAEQWARLRIYLAERGRRLNLNDLWIAAVAVAHGLPVVTQDSDFDALEDYHGFSQIQV